MVPINETLAERPAAATAARDQMAAKFRQLDARSRSTLDQMAAVMLGAFERYGIVGDAAVEHAIYGASVLLRMLEVRADGLVDNGLITETESRAVSHLIEEALLTLVAVGV